MDWRYGKRGSIELLRKYLVNGWEQKLRCCLLKVLRGSDGLLVGFVSLRVDGGSSVMLAPYLDRSG